ncbi:MAG: hypothetical protein Q4B48_06335 [Syntrophomonadaceae bacterium]|nr:hypothetical protein [Syntrophomonadaceae bacterium]
MRDKLEWWEELYRRVAELGLRGIDAAAISERLLGAENAIAQVTEGDMCRLNLVKSFLHSPHRPK